MATDAYVDDVFTLVQALTQSDLANRLMRSEAGTDEIPDGVDIAVDVSGQGLDSAIAIQQSLQLCVDAAVVTAELFGLDISRDTVAGVLRDGLAELTIMEAGVGSFWQRLTLNVKKKEGRGRALGIIGLAAIALAILLPAVGAVAVIVTEVLRNLNEVVTPDAIRQEELQEQIVMVTIDPTSVRDVMITFGLAGVAASEQPRQVYVYDVDQEADQPFVDRLHTVEGVEKQTRFIYGACEGYQRVRVWSANEIADNAFRQYAKEAGVRIDSINKVTQGE